MATRDASGLQEGKPNIYLDTDMSDYLSAKAVGRSDIALFMRSPAHHQWNGGGSRDTGSSEIKTIGSAANDLFLQPEVYEKKYFVDPLNPDKRTKVGREYFAELKQNYGDGNIMSPFAETVVRAMVKSLEQNEEAMLMKQGVIESSLLWRDDMGILLRGRPDSIYSPRKNHATIYDLKTTHDGSEEEFSKHFYSFCYYIQAALYRRGLLALSNTLESADFRFVVVETTAPYIVRVFPVNQEDAAFADEVIDTVLETMAYCIEHDEFPGYIPVKAISLPRWARYKIERELADLRRLIPRRS